MTRPPPFSPLSVCPKPLPSPKPFGTRTPAQAAGSKPLLRPVFPTEGAKEQGYCLFYHIFPVNARALRLFLQRKPAQTICAGRERLSKLARAYRHMQTPHSRRQFAATRRQNTAPAQGRSEADRAMAQVGPRPRSACVARGAGAGPRCAAGLRSTTVMGSRSDCRSAPHAAAAPCRPKGPMAPS